MSSEQLPEAGPFCPRCGWPAKRVHRHTLDRWAGVFRSAHRYHCSSPHCGWEGLLARSGGHHAPDPSVEWRTRVLWFVLGLAVALAAVQGWRLYQRSQQARGHPTQLATGGAELKSQATPPGQDFEGEALPTHDERVVGNRTPLALRNSCSWGVPGSNKYRGTVEQALWAAMLPPEVVRQIAEKAEHGWTLGQVAISRDGIRTVDQRRQFDGRMLAMAFGNTLCFNTRVNFVPGHVEYASLYEASDNRGRKYTVIVPFVCQNVAVLGERAEITENGHSTPEPETLGMAALGLALLGWSRRRAAARGAAR
jgi:MYXO-CTERM domain-containing protein